jgi:hypothetical protein
MEHAGFEVVFGAADSRAPAPSSGTTMVNALCAAG